MDREPDPTRRMHARAESFLERHGVLTRGALGTERVVGGFAGVYRVLRAMEDSGRVRRGYVVDGLGAAQFAVPGAIDRLRALSRPVGEEIPQLTAPVIAEALPVNPPAPRWQPEPPTDPDPTPSDDAGPAPAERWVPEPGWQQPPRAPTRSPERPGPPAVVLAAADPAQPYGAALPWPATVGDSSHRPGRKAGSLVVLVDGAPALYVERGGRSLLSFTVDRAELAAAARALATAVHEGGLGSLAVERADGAASLTSDVAEVLTDAGFRVTPKGLRLRA
jgi:ATP-dependent Lhr-like helicase